MAELPRYRRSSVRALQPSATQRPDLRESVARSNMIAQEIGQMSDFVNAKLTEKRTEEGQQAVYDLGDSEVRERISSEGGPSGTAERAAWDLSNQIGSNRLYGEAVVEMQRIADQGESEQAPYELINSQLQDAVDGFSAALSQFDPAIAAQLRQRLDTAAASMDARYLNTYTQVQNDANALRSEQHHLTIMGQTEQEIRNDGYNNNASKMIDAHIASITNDPSLSDRDKERLLSDVKYRTDIAEIRFDLQSIPITQQEGYINDLIDRDELLNKVEIG